MEIHNISLKEYIDGILNGNRMLLSRAVTLTESTKTEHQELAAQIIEACLPHSGHSVRVGITGVPGVGKSTFIEAFGNIVLEKGHRLAVLTVDPSSSKSRGSILGDKTRMETLAAHQDVYVRPSPTSGSLGGVAGKTRESMILFEAAGYDYILIETVGVGQSETAVHSMVDFFLLLMLAGAGDELQGIKRGIMEMAHAIVINKAEDNNLKEAKRAAAEYKNALHLFPPSESGWTPRVTTASALEGKGISEVWEIIQQYLEQVKGNGFFEQNRRKQALHWLNESIHRELHHAFYQNPVLKQKMNSYREKVQDGSVSPHQAARELMDAFLNNQ